VIPIARPSIGPDEQAGVAAVLDDGMIADGPEVRAFEREFADYCDAAHGVATSNGTTALHAALAALGVGPGDRVLTTPFSYVATANAVRLAGATPVFADIDPETYALDPDAAAARLDADDDIAAILVVHLYGLPADMDRFRALADEHDVALVEDAAQAHGARYRGEPVGSLGDAGCFSFYPTKNMTTGEGGMVVTDDPDLAERAARFVNHGRDDEGRHVTLGHNFRLTSVAAAMGRAQLDKLPGFIEARRSNAARLAERLEPFHGTLPTEPDGRRHAYHQFTVRTPERERFRAHLEERGVGSKVYYPVPIHREPAYDRDESYPAAERAAEEVVSLPVYPELTDDELATVADAAASFAEVVR
jgi:dTDP-4-amino-4,6-dideoxygalactose transaminase